MEEARLEHLGQHVDRDGGEPRVAHGRGGVWGGHLGGSGVGMTVRVGRDVCAAGAQFFNWS